MGTGRAAGRLDRMLRRRPRHLAKRVAAIAANPDVHASRSVPAETGASGNEGTGRNGRRTGNRNTRDALSQSPYRTWAPLRRNAIVSKPRPMANAVARQMCTAMSCDVEEPAGWNCGDPGRAGA